ncbi:MAG: Holliday junction branch migration protein RuvA [Thermoanaerobaculia bacterium]
MIGHLRGTARRLAPDRVLLEVGGVGYEVHIPLSTYYELEKNGGRGEIALHVHTHVRDDAIELFGFASEREKRLFERLIAVSGVGPRLARTVLSGMAPTDLVTALAGADVARLSTIPGIGRKTAERLVLELKDKMQELAVDLPPAAAASTEERDLVAALVNLGYRERQAEEAVARAREAHPEAAFQELLRASLQRLSRG